MLQSPGWSAQYIELYSQLQQYEELPSVRQEELQMVKQKIKELWKKADRAECLMLKGLSVKVHRLEKKHGLPRAYARIGEIMKAFVPIALAGVTVATFD